MKLENLKYFLIINGRSQLQALRWILCATWCIWSRCSLLFSGVARTFKFQYLLLHGFIDRLFNLRRSNALNIVGNVRKILFQFCNDTRHQLEMGLVRYNPLEVMDGCYPDAVQREGGAPDIRLVTTSCALLEQYE